MYYSSVKYLLAFVALLCCFLNVGCSGGEKSGGLNPNKEVPNIFKDKVFMCAPGIDADSSFAYGECDCCSDEIIFRGDSDVVFISFCMGDQTVFKGKYTIEDGELILEFEEEYADYAYNTERETDSTVVEYILTRKRQKLDKTRYRISKCRGKALISWESKSPQYGMESDLAVDGEIKKLKDIGIWKVLYGIETDK